MGLPLVTGTNNSARQVSVNAWNDLIDAVNAFPALSVEQFGAVGDGVTDDTAAIQAGIDYLEATDSEGPLLFRADGIYKITSKLTVNRGIWLEADSSLPNATNGTPTAMTPRIVWGAAGGDTMLEWVSDTTEQAINYGGIRGLTFDGNNVATNGVYLRSPAYTEIDLTTYRTTSNGLLIDDSNTTLANAVNIKRYVHFCGSNSAAWSCNGLFIDGDTSGKFATSIVAGFIDIEHVNGHGITFRSVDSCYFPRAKVYHRSGSSATGKSVRYLKSTNYPTFHAQKNVIGMLIAGGHIYVGDFCKNNVIERCITEQGSLVYESATADKRANHFRFHDFRNSGVWKSHEWRLNDQPPLPLGDWVGYGTTATATTLAGTGAGRVYSFAAATQNGISWAGRTPNDWNTGTVTGLRIQLVSVGAAVGDVVFKAQGLGRAPAASVGGFSTNVTATLTPAQSVTNTESTHTLTFTTAISVTKNGFIALALERMAADAADTYPNAIHVLSVTPIYAATGPASASTYGPYGETLISGADPNP